MAYKFIGKSYDRPDSISKATGKALYLDDIRLPHLLHALILRPPYAHARILSIDTREAEQMPGVVKVVTGQDCPHRYGDVISDMIPMAVDKVRFIGEAVAAVVAGTPAHARAALAKIKVEYEPLPVYVDARDAIKPDAELIHKDLGSYWHFHSVNPRPGTNIANIYHLNKGKGEAGFEEADVIVEGEFYYPFGSCAALEPHGAIVWFKEDHTIEVWTPTISAFVVREELAKSYSLPVSDVRVHVPDIGGCFGYKSDVIIEETVAWIASFVPGYPVKWVATRAEDFTSTMTGHGVRTKMKMGARKDGTLVALKAEVLHGVGAYADAGINVTAAATHNCTGPYEFPHCDLTGTSVYTNTPPVAAFRGYGHAEAHLPVERMIDLLARKLDMDSLQLRAKNYLCEGRTTALGERIWKTHGDLKQCASIVQKDVFSRPKPKEDENYYYGYGFAALMKTPKGATHSTKGCYMKMNSDGSVSVSMSGAEIGQGLQSAVRQIAAEALQIPPEKIRVYREIDTQFSPYEWQTVGSLFIVQGGRAILRAAEKMIAQLKRNAAQALKTDEDYLEYDGEAVFLRNDPAVRVAVSDIARAYVTEDGIAVGEMVQAVSDARLPRYAYLDENGQGSAGVAYTFGMQAAEVRIEKKSGKIIVDHFSSAFDIGQVINPRQARGSVTGGVLMALGAALYEKMDFAEDGQLLNPHFFKYHLPTYKEAPAYSVEFVETPDAIGPFGARGIGEHSSVGVAPAILNAIYDATGIDFFEVPVTPEMMKDALARKQE